MAALPFLSVMSVVVLHHVKSFQTSGSLQRCEAYVKYMPAHLEMLPFSGSVLHMIETLLSRRTGCPRK